MLLRTNGSSRCPNPKRPKSDVVEVVPVSVVGRFERFASESKSVLRSTHERSKSLTFSFHSAPHLTKTPVYHVDELQLFRQKGHRFRLLFEFYCLNVNGDTTTEAFV
ncbi:hypothetical protein U1Q18_009529 [Sarracenia purpurea var. burkii]